MCRINISLRTLIVSVALVLAAGLTGLVPGGAAAAVPRPSKAALTPACAKPRPGDLMCAAVIGPARKPGTVSPDTGPSGYGPPGLEDAYGVQATTEGMLQTVAVVEGSGDSSAAADLATYRSNYSLAPCTVRDGCLTVIDQTGGLGGEVDAAQTAIDLDAVSATCPNCKIILVREDGTNFADDLGPAVNTAVSHGATVVDISYAGPEQSSQEATWDSQFLNHPGVAIVAAAGNSGYSSPINYPAASPDVISVGGTVLDRSGATGCTSSQAGVRGWCEAGWSQTTSGCSEFESAPAWQSTSTGCSGRADNDTAAVAASTATPDPVAYYNTGGGGSGWGEAGSTGTSAPIVAGLIADAGTPGASDNPAQYLYDHPGGGYINPGTAYPYFAGVNDITSGSNAPSNVCIGTIVPLCQAGAGWDGITGVGSPEGAATFTPNGNFTGNIYSGLFYPVCLDNQNGNIANNNPIQAFTCSGSRNGQQWVIGSDGTLRIQGNTGFCIGVSGGNTTDGANIILFGCDGAQSQQWRPTSIGELVNEKSGKCMQDPSQGSGGSQLVIEPCNTSDASEQWIYTSPTPSATGEIESQTDTSLCLDNFKGTLSAGNPVDIWSCNGHTDTQQWTLESNGQIRIGSSWCIEPGSVQVAGGTQAAIFPCSPNIAQINVIRSDGSMALGGSWFEVIQAVGTTNGDAIIYHPEVGNYQWVVP